MKKDLSRSVNVNAVKVNAVKTQFALAAALGVNRRSITRWLRVPGNPGVRTDGRYDVDGWAAWISARGPEPAGNSGPGADDSTLTAAKLSEANLKNWRIAFKNAELQGQYWPADEVKRVCAQALSAVKTRAFSGLPRLVSLVKLAADDENALAAARKEMLQVFQSMETCDWFKP